MSERTRDLPPRYDPVAVEPHWSREWVERGYFHATSPSDRQPFCIVIPPPNVTGRLHVGHAFDHTIQDILIRHARMRGLETLWLPGMDHAGIATQVVVERELRKEGLDRRELGRDAFVERVWGWKERYGGEILEQIKRMGSSCDWSRERFTMDEGLSRAVRVAFVRWYEQGFIYRGERLVNWCPTDQTGLSDSEVEHEEVDGELVTFRYPLSDGSGHVEVATTRVETMLGDTGIAVHPEDERYRSLVGSTVRHPFDGRDLPIVADAAVDLGFGTGAVKVTPAHDPTDFEIAQRTGLELLNIFDAEARINENAAEEFYGLGRYEAREAVTEELHRLDLFVRAERPFRHAVGHCYRCHSEIEPWISGLQWFVKVDALKEAAKQAALDGRVRFTPERWTKPYVTWLDNLRDWNISRQLWWGHRIPAWYCRDDHVTVALEDPDACSTCGSGELEQDPDVLDTWFSSQLWPFSTLGWPEETEDLQTFYPNSVLVTGYEILYLWVARMIMSGLSLVGDVPFRDVVIHGLVRDAHGRKMSKSLGNVIDPIEMIDRYGADALRFSLARAATGGQQDIPLSEDSIEGGRNFANKIWNAARLVLGAFDAEHTALPPRERWTIAQRWLLARHQACVEEVDAALGAYQFSDAAQAIYRFLWSEYCDWGLEVEKGRLEADAEERAEASAVLAWVLERTLRLLHPVMPFVTEEIWQRLGTGTSISVAPWPESQPEHADPDAVTVFSCFQEVVTAVRQFRARHQIAPSLRFPVRIALPEDLSSRVAPLGQRVARLAGLGDVTFVGPREGKLAGESTATLSAGAVYLPPGLFDVEAERARLSKQRDGLDVDLARIRGKLANAGFVEKAPPEIVEGEREKAARIVQQLADIDVQLGELS
jgi:valyl-tRNA synthetase